MAKKQDLDSSSSEPSYDIQDEPKKSFDFKEFAKSRNFKIIAAATGAVVILVGGVGIGLGVSQVANPGGQGSAGAPNFDKQGDPDHLKGFDRLAPHGPNPSQPGDPRLYNDQRKEYLKGLKEDQKREDYGKLPANPKEWNTRPTVPPIPSGQPTP